MTILLIILSMLFVDGSQAYSTIARANYGVFLEPQFILRNQASTWMHTFALRIKELDLEKLDRQPLCPEGPDSMYRGPDSTELRPMMGCREFWDAIRTVEFVRDHLIEQLKTNQGLLMDLLHQQQGTNEIQPIQSKGLPHRQWHCGKRVQACCGAAPQTSWYDMVS